MLCVSGCLVAERISLRMRGLITAQIVQSAVMKGREEPSQRPENVAQEKMQMPGLDFNDLAVFAHIMGLCLMRTQTLINEGRYKLDIIPSFLQGIIPSLCQRVCYPNGTFPHQYSITVSQEWIKTSCHTNAELCNVVNFAYDNSNHVLTEISNRAKDLQATSDKFLKAKVLFLQQQFYLALKFCMWDKM